jgi:hypothetical protein
MMNAVYTRSWREVEMRDVMCWMAASIPRERRAVGLSVVRTLPHVETWTVFSHNLIILWIPAIGRGCGIKQAKSVPEALIELVSDSFLHWNDFLDGPEQNQIRPRRELPQVRGMFHTVPSLTVARRLETHPLAS